MLAPPDFQTLIQLPESRRDDRWEAEFLDAMINLKITVEGEEPKAGPDAWPYLFVRTTVDATEPFARVVQWAAARGIGLVVNAHKMMPDYVFTYGMLWNFVATGRFTLPIPIRAAGEFAIPKNAVMGAPTEQYLPKSVRQILREFLLAQGFANVKVLVISSADFKEVDLALSVESLNNLATKEHKVLAEALAWFLPLHYHLVFVSETNLPKFHKL